jgi:hypothetical protein
MTIRYKCEECGAALNINDELAGTEGSCPRCYVEFVVPSADSPAAVATSKPKKATGPGGTLASEDEIGDFLSSDEITVPTGNTSLARSDGDGSDDEGGSGASDNPFDDDAPRRARKKTTDDEDAGDDDELEARGKKKPPAKSKSGGPSAKSESAGASAIAKSLMGKGAAPVEEEPDGATKKKKRRQFGEGSDRPEGEISSTRDVIKYFAKMGWPAIVGMVAIAGITYWVMSRMERRLDLPPLALVTGTITVDGKPVAAGTMVQFVPADQKNLKLGSSVGFTDASGKYTLQYTSDVKGAVIGKHSVLVTRDPGDPDPSHAIDLYYSQARLDMQFEVIKEGKPIDIALKSNPWPSAEQ